MDLNLEYINYRDWSQCLSLGTQTGHVCTPEDPCPKHLHEYKVGGVRIIVFVYLFVFLLSIELTIICNS